MLTMKLLSMYFTFLVFVAVDFTETRRHHHRGCSKRPHPCPIPGGRNGVCVPPHLCSQPAGNVHPNRKENHFCRSKHRYDEPTICCLKTLDQDAEKIPSDNGSVESNSEGIDIENVDEIIKEKCTEYTKVAMDVDAQVESGRFFQPFVVGGTTSLAKEFPHVALLGFGREDNIEWKCGGGLISDKFILTAAHCLYSFSGGDVNFVRLGDLNINSNTDDAKPQQFKVAQRHSHPDYISGESQYNDIALIELDNPVTFTKYVRPACLQMSEDKSSALIAAGFGSTEFGGPTSEVLLKVDLVYYSYEECNQTFGPQRRLERGIDEDSQLCAGGADGQQKDTCQGDSGSPLQTLKYQSPKVYEIVGVTSFGKACGLPNVPGVYSKVSYFSPWIVDIVWPEK